MSASRADVNDSATVEIFTVGHSNRSLEAFLNLLKEFEIGVLVDVRRFPSSRRFPHFSRGALEKAARGVGSDYFWVEALGGRRPDLSPTISPNLALQGPLRIYADYMMTEAFCTGATELMGIAERQRTAVMCAEKLFWKCHRMLLSDYLCAQGVSVQHIVEFEQVEKHRRTPEAHAHGKTIIYPLPLGFDPSP